MPNGFHGSAEHWEKIEAPLRQIDRQLEKFAKAHAMSIGKNYHNWPERSLSWSSEGLRRLIQIYLKDATKETYCLWLCASEDRGHERYWKKQFLLDNVTWTEVQEGLERHLDQAYKTVQAWSASDLEFGGKIRLP
jgi:hypothetical protein